jgi:DNA-binding NarL/FixJ family response regulator
MSQLTRILLSGDLSPKWPNLVRQLMTSERFAVTKYEGASGDVLKQCRLQVPCVLITDEACIDRFRAAEFCDAVGFGRLIRVLVEIKDYNPGKIERLIRMGCAGVLSQDTSPLVACRALQAILAGQLWVDPKTVSRVIQNMLRDQMCGLTFREIEILGLLADGLKNYQIGERLFISPQTVRWHLRSLYRKLGTHDRLSAVGCASLYLGQASAPNAPRLADPTHRALNGVRDEVTKDDAASRTPRVARGRVRQDARTAQASLK